MARATKTVKAGAKTKKAKATKTTKTTKTTKVIASKTKAVSKTVAPKKTKITKTVAVKKAKTTQTKTRAIKEKQTRSEILQHVSELTGLKRVEVDAVFSAFSEVVKGHMKKRGSGEVMIPRLGVKIRRVQRRASKARTMVSPLTGTEVVIPAKPKRSDIKLVALKPLKESVED